jgi:hypothetical protein
VCRLFYGGVSPNPRICCALHYAVRRRKPNRCPTPKSLQLPSGYPELFQELKTRIAPPGLGRQPGTGSPLLVDRACDPGTPKGGRWGCQGHRPSQLGPPQQEFPGVEGNSPRNLKDMLSLPEAWPDPEIVPQFVALLPWGIFGF